MAVPPGLVRLCAAVVTAAVCVGVGALAGPVGFAAELRWPLSEINCRDSVRMGVGWGKAGAFTTVNAIRRLAKPRQPDTKTVASISAKRAEEPGHNLMQCPACAWQIDGVATQPGQPGRCPECGATLSRSAKPPEPDLLPVEEGVRQNRRTRDADLPPQCPDLGWDSDFSDPRPSQLQRRGWGAYPFLNPTTIGALLGFTLAEYAMLSLVVFSKGVKSAEDVLGASVASVCVGIVGAAFGIVGGWLIDAIIRVVRKAAMSSAEQPDRGWRARHFWKQHED